MDEEALYALKKSVECVVCYEPQHNPKHLPCYHSICKECLDDMLRFDIDGSAILTCPNRCKRDITIKKYETTNMLPNNYSLDGVLDILKKSNKKTSTCLETTGCSNVACRSCLNCSNKTCSSCWNKHPCQNKNFITVSFDWRYETFQPHCIEHESHAKHICLDCNEKLVCVYCLKRNHKSHRSAAIELYTPQTRASILSLLDEALKYRPQTNDSYDEELSKIESFRSELNEELQIRKLKQLRKVIDHLNSEQKRLLDTFDETVQTFTKNLATNKNLGKNADTAISKYKEEISKKEDFEVLCEKSTILDNIASLSSTHRFNATLTDVVSGMEPLGQLNMEMIHETEESTSDNIVTTHLSNIYDTDVEKDEDLKIVQNGVIDVESSLQTTMADLLATRRNEEKIRNVVKEKTYTLEDIYELVKENHATELNLILKHHAEFLHMKDDNGKTILQLAAENGKDLALKYILQNNNEHVNDTDTFAYSTTALMNASSSGFTSCVELLIQHGAKVDMKNSRGSTAIIMASMNGHAACLEVLLQNRADVKIKHRGSSALHESSLNGHTACVELLILYGAEVNARDSSGNTALTMATGNGHASCAELLLKHHADPNIRIMSGSTALMVASQNGHASCLELLLGHRADARMKNNSGNTALLLASKNGHASCMQLLINQGADVNVKNYDGCTPLMLATEHSYKECVDVLLQHNSNINVTNYKGETAFNIADRSAQFQGVKKMIDEEIQRMLNEYRERGNR